MLIKKTTPHQDVGFLTLFAGGIGLSAGGIYRQRYEADGRPFPMVAVSIDTDPVTADYIDETIHFGLDGRKLDALKADPARFGVAAEAICAHLGDYLTAEDASNGSRTIRGLTQAAFSFHEKRIAIGLRKAIHRLVDSHRVKTIIPIIVGSSGGGTGSALQVLLPFKLRERAFREQVLQGCESSLLQPPICFVSDPYALAQVHDSAHGAKILANAFAFRIESAALEKVHGTKYVIHIGFANSKGTVLSQPSLIARVLGTSVYEWQRGWPEIKNRLVDTADVNALSDTGYVGRDLPENRLASQLAAPAPSATPSTNGQHVTGGLR